MHKKGLQVSYETDILYNLISGTVIHGVSKILDIAQDFSSCWVKLPHSWVFLQYHCCSTLNRDSKFIWEWATMKLKSHISFAQEPSFQVLRDKRSPISASQRMPGLWLQGSNSSKANLGSCVSVQRRDQTYDTTGELSNRRLTIKVCQTTYVSKKHFCFSTYTFSNRIVFVETFLTSSAQFCVVPKLQFIFVLPYRLHQSCH